MNNISLNKNTLLIILALFLLLMTASQSWAGCQVYNGAFNSTVNFGTVVVGADVAVGETIAKVTTTPTGKQYGGCDERGGYQSNLMQYSWGDANRGNHVYQTELAGIGLRIKENNIYFDNPGLAENDGPTYYNSGFYDKYGFIVELVKTANTVQGGKLTNGRVAANVSIYGPGNPPASALNLYMGNATIVAPSCTVSTPTVNVNLGTWDTDDLPSIGAKTSNVAVPLQLNCGSNVQVNATIAATADTSQQGTMKISSGSGAASGVGIQMVDSYGSPLKLNSQFVASSSSNGMITLPWYAHYIRTGSAVTPGSANAVATVTLNYQ